MVSGLTEDHVLQVVVAQALSMLSDVSTAECVGELLAIRLEIQMPLAIRQLHMHKLTLTMSMESVSLMEYLVTTSGPMLLVYQKEAMKSNKTIVHVVIPVTQAANFHHLLLKTTTTVSPATQGARWRVSSYTTLTHSGMVSSVKVSVAAMENLLHGSVWSYPTQQLMILRYAFVLERVIMMKP